MGMEVMPVIPTLWLIIIGGALGTFALRLSFIGAPNALDALPDSFNRSLRFLPAAVLAALAVPAVLAPDGPLALTPDNARLPAGVIAVAVAARTESVFWTIAAGMGSLWLFRAILF